MGEDAVGGADVFGAVLEDAVVAAVGDEDGTVRAGGDGFRVVDAAEIVRDEAGGSRGGLAEGIGGGGVGGGEGVGVVEALDPVVAGVSDPETAGGVEGDADGFRELVSAGAPVEAVEAGLADDEVGGAIGVGGGGVVEFDDAVVELVGDPEVVGGVDGDGGGGVETGAADAGEFRGEVGLTEVASGVGFRVGVGTGGGVSEAEDAVVTGVGDEEVTCR